MTSLRELLLSHPIDRISDYFSLSRKIELAMDTNELSTEKLLKIAIVSSSTTNGTKEILRIQCAELNLSTQFYVGDYNQYAQDILNPASNLYGSKPDLVIINVDTRAIAGEHFFVPYDMSAEARRAWAEEKIGFLADLALGVCMHSSAKVILHNLEIPTYSPLGLTESKQDFGFIEAIEEINRGLKQRFKNTNQVFVFDYDAFCSRIGKDNVVDPKMYYLGDIKLKPQHLPLLCREYTRYVLALASLTKKCIVLDLDNTLWGGIIGESGLDGIQLGPTPEGRPFMEFQQCLLSLSKRGVILAVNSKNNPDDALAVMREHPHMVLHERDFAAMRINWYDKAANMVALAEEINIGLDSLVFFDDDHVNRELVRTQLPDVVVVDLPRDPAMYVKTLTSMPWFDTLVLTEEDQKKARMYSADRERRTLGESVSDLGEYLLKMDITVSLDEANRSTVPRIAQLTQKTNQFNTTTRRYSEEAIAQMSGSGDHRVISLHVSDKFGDNGLTGVAIVDKTVPDTWRIDSFLLSCRIIGRRAEDTLLAYIVEEAQRVGAKRLYGEFIVTAKNAPARDLYEKGGFAKRDDAGAVEIWEYDLTKALAYPIHIRHKFGGR